MVEDPEKLAADRDPEKHTADEDPDVQVFDWNACGWRLTSLARRSELPRRKLQASEDADPRPSEFGRKRCHGVPLTHGYVCSARLDIGRAILTIRFA